MKLVKTYQLLILLSCCSLIVFSCGKESSCFKGSGNDITELRTVTTEITKVVLEDNIDLIITQGNTAELKLTGGENLLPYINTDVSGNELKLSSDNKCGFFRNYNRPLTAHLTVPNVNEIYYVGQGAIICTNTLNTPNFLFETRNGTGSINLDINTKDLSVLLHTGPADITLKGNSDKAYYYGGGNGWMFCKDLIAQDVHVNNDSSGDIIVTASNTLLVELNSIGNIDYYGNPTVTVSVDKGKGKLRKK